MSLEQRAIPLRFLDGSTGEAVCTGNNAAWHCVCSSQALLIGRSGLEGGVTENFRVDCPRCLKSYFVVPEAHSQSRAARVEEVERN